MATQEQCKQRIIKIAENNVEHQYYLFDANGNPVVLPEFTTTYGQAKIDTDRAQADTDKAYWDGIDSAAIADQFTTANEQVAFYDTIQTVMNAADGTIEVIV